MKLRHLLAFLAVLAAVIGLNASRSFAHTHCGTPQAEPDCPTTTVPATSTTVATRTCNPPDGRPPYATPIDKPCPPGSHEPPPSGPPVSQPPYVPPPYSCGPTQAPSNEPCPTLVPPTTIVNPPPTETPTPDSTEAPPPASVPSAATTSTVYAHQPVKALPVTGSEDGPLVAVVGCFIISGSALVAVSRKRASR